MMSHEFPKTWMEAELKDLVPSDGVFTDGDWVESKDQDPDGDVRLIQLADIGDGRFRNKSARFLTKAKAGELGCTFLKTGDILIARMPDPLGRACIFPLSGGEKYVTVVDVCVVRLSEATVSNVFLCYLINSAAIRHQIEDFESGTTRKRISGKNLARVRVPLPPLPEQRRIVAKIEELFSELDQGVENLKQARAQLAVYRQALLKHAFDGHLTAAWRTANKDKLEPAPQLLARLSSERDEAHKERMRNWELAHSQWRMEGARDPEPKRPMSLKPATPFPTEILRTLPPLPDSWSWVRLSDLAVQLTKGASPKWQGVSYTADSSQVLFVTSENVRENHIDISTPKFVETKFNELQPNSIFEDGDILINIVGASIGRAAVFEGSRLANTNQAVAVVRLPFPPLRKFIAHLLNTRFIYNYLVNQSVDVARANVSLVDVANIPIPVCSFAEVAAIMSQLDSSLSTLGTLEADIDTNFQKSEALRQAILKKAFAGELVPQDPADEPAAALLARLRAERASAPKPARARAGKTPSSTV